MKSSSSSPKMKSSSSSPLPSQQLSQRGRPQQKQQQQQQPRSRIKLKVLYVVLSIVFLVTVLSVNVTYTNLQQTQELQLDQLHDIPTIQSSSSSSSSSLSGGSSGSGSIGSAMDDGPISIEALARRQRLKKLLQQKNRTIISTITKTTNNRLRRRESQQQQQQQQYETKATTATTTATGTTGNSQSSQNIENPSTYTATDTVKSNVGVGKAQPQSSTSSFASSFSSSSSSSSRYAYAFLIGGVHEDRPAYRGFLYNVLIATHILRKLGSTMDIWLYIQLSPDSQLKNTLPMEDLRLLHALQIKIQYINHYGGEGGENNNYKESFSDLVYDKFRILQMTQYKRVMFLDGDIIPLTNMDYLFQLSDDENPIIINNNNNEPLLLLRPNFIMASRGEPCNAGMFILEPKVGEWEALQDVIAQQHESAKNLPYPKFDREYGWGHSFKQYNDVWEGINKNGTMWRYHASHSDQGLLFYWVKYIKQDVTIALGDRLVTWGPPPAASGSPLLSPPSTFNGTIKEYKPQPIRIRDIYRPVTPYLLSKQREEPLAWQEECDNYTDTKSYFCTVPYSEFAHFMGSNKPWQLGTGVRWMKPSRLSSKGGTEAPYRLWFDTLRTLNDRYDMKLDFTQMEHGIPGMTETPLGHMAMFSDHHNRVAATSKLASTSREQQQGSTSTSITGTGIVISSSSSSTATNPMTTASQQQQQQQQHSRYAYAFLIGGVHEDRPAYRGFLYNVLIAAHLLHKLGSTMDIWLYIQLSPDSQLINTLPAEDLRLLNALQIHVEYVDRPIGKESFSELVYDKFRILQMTQYKRVMFLDADAIPLANMDYLFRLSEEKYEKEETEETLKTTTNKENDELPVLQPNFIMASRGEPCNAGMFILEPKVGEWEALQDVIAQQHESAKDLAYPKFNREYGWGHSFIQAGDVWESIHKNGTLWKYHASHSDQGLLFYWVKYIKQQVTVAMGDTLVTWGPGTKTDGTYDGKPQPVRLREVYRPLTPYMDDEPLAWQEECESIADTRSYYCTAPYREFAHFMGGQKPWQLGTERKFFKHRNNKGRNAPYRLWFATLEELNANLTMGLDFSQIKYGIPDLTTTPLGHLAMFSDHHDRVAAKLSNAAALKEKDNGNEDETALNHRGLEGESNVQPAMTNPNKGNEPNSKYAYAYLMGGVHEERPAYRGFLYDVLISANILRKTGSVMDVWLFVQISPDSALVTLPEEDTRLLSGLNIRVQYLEPPKARESFNELVYDKFRILQMTQYRRVMFLDADTIPLTNMDYFFSLSEGETPLLRPNFIMASRGEPCNAGMFILEPKEGEWEELQEVIAKEHEAAKDLPYPNFDRLNGWGHNFVEAGDVWEGIHQNGTAWKFHASHSDQGLLYYWVKYVKQNVSIAVGNKLVNWGAGEDGQPVPEQILMGALHPYMSKQPLAWQMGCDRNDNNYFCTPPYREFAHFMGGNKPWQKGSAWSGAKGTSTQERWAPYRLWFKELAEISDMFQMGLDIGAMGNGIEGLKETPLGHMAMWWHHSERVGQLANASAVVGS